MKELIENIKGCPDSAMGIWVGSIYLGTVEDAQALVNAYTQLKADLATAKQGLEYIANPINAIQHITDGHGCGRYQVLCSACEAKRIAMEALIDDD